MGARSASRSPASERPEPEVPIGGDQSGGGRYGETGRRKLPTIAIIVALHALLIVVIATADVHRRHHHSHHRLRIVELRMPPERQPHRPPPRHRQDKQLPPPIMAPPPIVQIPVSITPVQASPVASPVPPAPSAAPPAAVVSETAAPVSAPDGTAKTLGNPSPRYPLDARRNHQEGIVRLRVVISADGHVIEIGVARSSGVDSLDKAALETVRKWRFLPGKQAGVAVEAIGFLNIPFRLTTG